MIQPRIAIYGAGGFGKEVKGMLELQHHPFSGFIDDYREIPELSNNEFDDLLIAIADPAQRKSVYERWKRKAVSFSHFISKDTSIHPSITVGKGSIICPGVRMTVDIKIEEFVIVNLNVTIGHDVYIGNFCSLMPSVNISGNVTIGDSTYIGSGATVLQGLSIGKNATIGAGAVVTHNVPDHAVVVGVPARERRQ